MEENTNVVTKSSFPMIPVVLIGLVVLGGLFFLFSRNNTTNTPVTESTVPTQTTTEETSISPASGETSEETQAGAVKEFTVDGDNFTFSLKEIKVKEGDTVKITFNNVEGFHDLVLDEFNAKTKQLAAGQSETIQFVADKAGTYEYYCSVGQHRQMGMKGNLIVE